MIEQCIAQYGEPQAFEDEIALVERVWDAPLPEGLSEIGGIDWHGWAKICKRADDPPGVFFGEHRDALSRYVGLWRIGRRGDLPEVLPTDEDILAHYYLGSYSNHQLLIRAYDAPGQPYAFLIPAAPENIETAPRAEP
ncbi:hypothetical protein [Jannaschia pohangensis]|uniref:Uncharacterized protein n=1 Tax=Jannaschia pohangensis TaxID=390807 RepID=A0A1I3GUL1_9RHOB|nr:hypothetical protein [Jannaschia pohangensis]SFI27265.1 hypothetical protein SAMN04488095_0342 [Jannaschia pohangensis]